MSENSRRAVLALFPEQEQAREVVDRLVARDLPMDRVSLLGPANASGDDPLGVYYSNVGERMKGWGAHGAFWGGLWGLLSGAAGMFLIPGVGPVLAAGPLVEALVGAGAGAGLVGGALAVGAAADQLFVAMHRIGVPEESIHYLVDKIRQGHFLVMLIVPESERDHWLETTRKAGSPEKVLDFPYVGLREWIAGDKE